MALRPNGKQLAIREQIIEDPVSGLTSQFEVSKAGKSVLRVYGELPFGNREFIFDHNGEEAAAGTSLRGLCRATWVREVGD